MFQIQFAPEALEDLSFLRKYEQQQIIDGIETQLSYQPDLETRNKKRLRPNLLAEWELRVGNLRVFYDIDIENTVVKIVAVGLKQDNQLFIQGEQYEL